MKTKLDRSQIDLKRRIKNILYRPFGFMYIPSNWDKKIGAKSTSEIYEYIKERFAETDDEIEYYSAMVMLYHHVPDASLLIDWNNSQNRYRAAVRDQDEGDTTYNHLSQKTPRVLPCSNASCDDLNMLKHDVTASEIDFDTNIEL